MKRVIGKNVVTVSMVVGICVVGETGLAQSEQDAGELPPVMIISEAPQTDSRSVTLLSGDTLTIGGIQEVRDIQTVLPNFTVFDANNTRMPKFSVRGLRENSFGAGQSAIGMYVDGIPYTDLMTRGLSLYDIDHIEFLRGPQGTLFGAGAAPGGVINVRTRQPSAEWRTAAGLGYGEHNTEEYRLNTSGPLNEQIRLEPQRTLQRPGGICDEPAHRPGDRWSQNSRRPVATRPYAERAVDDSFDGIGRKPRRWFHADLQPAH
ncbi:MAG: hypothetical protein CM1200mP29_13420 [Verrucomicrobiota bacterium]|nr:MAG: hypothetical protein CM1200mP29_13420 [Verrucomicrobiota bacterium]